MVNTAERAADVRQRPDAPAPVAEALFVEEGGLFVPAEYARGPWGADVLFGGVPPALLVQEMERRHGVAGFDAARITTDLVRPAPMAALSVETEVVREGKRIRVIEGVVRSAADARPVARTTALFITGDDTVAPPPFEAEQESAAPPPGPAEWPEIKIPVAYPSIFDAVELRGPEPADGAREFAWVALRRPMLEGRRVSPAVQATLVADFASGIVNTRDGMLEYINADLTAYLHRPPTGAWLCVEAGSQLRTSTTALGSVRLHDAGGLTGVLSTASLRVPVPVRVI
ncbi:MAG: hypothetical protein GEU80_16085 [Dehalococcoidia bacterium]|nr:hypothetical protein [Dehalococcoidia bacterium]